MGFRFEELIIFKDAVDFTAGIYQAIKKFPDSERYILTPQIKDAANSVSLNIAEGSGRGTKKEFARFLDIAIGSCYEVVACVMVAERLGYLKDGEVKKIKDEAETLCKRINSFKRTLK